MSRKGMKSRTRGRKVRSTAMKAKTRVRRRRPPRADPTGREVLGLSIARKDIRAYTASAREDGRLRPYVFAG